VLRVDGDSVKVQTVSFPSRRSTRAPVRRDLASVTRQDSRWLPRALSPRLRDDAALVRRDEARFIGWISTAGRHAAIGNA
jgi:hypothetical protein